MKKIIYLIAIYFIFLILTACNKELKKWGNEDFEAALNNYYDYLDTVNYEQGFDYIYIEATQKNDSVIFLIYLCGGSYDFFKEKDRIADFFTYKGYDILLIGDFPNEILNIKKNKKLNVIEDIVKKRYRNDYNKYLQNEHLVAPLIYDYMDITLIFKGNKLISSKRQYY